MEFIYFLSQNVLINLLK